MTKSKAAQLADLIGEAPAPEPAVPMKRGRGQPKKILADTFDKAMANLKPNEAQFVRHVLAGDNHAVAYGKLHPNAGPGTRRVNAAKNYTGAQVKHALMLGRKAGAVAAITGLKYDVLAADKQIVDLIQAAQDADQYSACASLIRERLRLHKLTDANTAAVAGAAFTLILQGMDGSEKVLQPGGHTIDVTPRNEGTTE